MSLNYTMKFHCFTFTFPILFHFYFDFTLSMVEKKGVTYFLLRWLVKKTNEKLCGNIFKN